MFMLTSEQTGLPTKVLVALRREKLLAEGRHDAFIFVFECQCNAQRLREQIQETEEMIADPPDHLKGPMSPNASPRVYKDGYLAGLKDALRIVDQADGSAPRDPAPAPARAPTLAIAEGRSPYDTTSEPTPAASSEPAPPTTSRTEDG